MKPIVRSLVLGCILVLCSAATAEWARNPIIWADVPDVSTVRVGDTYYMSSTTMHLCPGLPIMKSRDLVNWEMAGYAYERLAENDAMNLAKGAEAYGRGTWASSLRYHNRRFYVSTFSATTGRTHVYSTANIEDGPWREASFEPVLHDNSLFFDDDGRVYMIYGGGEISIVELLPDASGIKPAGIHQVIIENTNAVFGDDLGGLPGEGSQLYKVDGKYYLFNIASPGSHWARTVLIHRADQITGPYEGRIALQDRHIAQGGLIETPEGRWYATLFGDRGAVGRIPFLVPVTWEDGWPVLGIDGKVPGLLKIEETVAGLGDFVASDDFERFPGERALPLAWQWNHQPDNGAWEILRDPGRLRLTTSRIDPHLFHARNTLTQRSVGPKSTATTAINVRGMRDGDVAGLIAFQNRYGFVGVKQEGGESFVVAAQSRLPLETGDEKPTIHMVHTLSEKEIELARIPLEQDKVFLRLHGDFETDVATFSYSLDGENWEPIGEPLEMVYTFTKHFRGYRYGLFNYATAEPGGHVDFDFYHIEVEAETR